jgi:hypothetical protein
MRLPALPIFSALVLSLFLAAPLPLRAQTAAPVPSATPATKTLFLIRGPDGIVTPIHAVTFQEQGAVLLLVNEKGGRAVVQARTVVGQLPWFTGEEVEAGAADPRQLAAKYEIFATRFPSLRKFLLAEADIFHAIQKRRDAAAAAKKAAAEVRIQAVTAAKYDVAAGYTVEALESLLQAADAVRGEEPDAAERIDAWAAPFRDHLEKLKAGSRYLDGVWVTPEEMARRTRAEREAAFLKSLDAPRIAALALPADAVHGFVTRTALVAGIAMLLGLGLIVIFRRRMTLRIAGVVLLIGGPTILATLYFLATRDPARLPAATAPADLRSVMAALEEAAAIHGDTPATEHTLSEAGLNSFLSRHVAIERTALAPWAVAREALAIRLLPDGASIFELVRCLGRAWIVRYDLTFRSTAAGATIVVSGVHVGALDCPGDLAKQLWKSLEPQLAATLSALHMDKQFVVTASGDGWIKIAPPSALPPAPATESASVSPTPVATASPAPSATPKNEPAPDATPDATPDASPDASPNVTPEAAATPAGNSPVQAPQQERNVESLATPTP